MTVLKSYFFFFRSNASSCHSAEFLRGWVFQYLKEPISSLLFCLLHRRNTFCSSIRFYDFQCSAQKSVSVMSLFDPRLIEAHRKAVEIGMRELERFAAVRIRQGESYATKNFEFTGKFIYAQYHHDNSRMLDPQLHTHNVIVNVTQERGRARSRRWTRRRCSRRSVMQGNPTRMSLACECRRLGTSLK